MTISPNPSSSNFPKFDFILLGIGVEPSLKLEDFSLMPNYIVETFYTCTFKIVHKLNELSEKKLSELNNRNDGKFEIIDIKLNNRKTKTLNDKKSDPVLSKSEEKKIPEVFLRKHLILKIHIFYTLI